MTKFPVRVAAAALFLTVPLTACSGGAEGEDKHEEGESHGEGEEESEGPNGGRLLKSGDFAVEVPIFENGTQPQFRVFPTQGGRPVDQKPVQLAHTPKRIARVIHRFSLQPTAPFTRGPGVATGPP